MYSLIEMISQEEAIEIAKREALILGWGWVEPINVSWRGGAGSANAESGKSTQM